MLVRHLGRVHYGPVYENMREFTRTRSPDEPDQLWICEHFPVFTLGLAGRREHLLDTRGVPVVHTDRGGQVTYHGPGQVVAYPLIDLRRAGYFVKEYVHRLEEALLRTLLHCGITGHRVRGAPGVYVRRDDPAGHARLPARFSDADLGATHPEIAKIAALGIKVSRHCAYHGLALNVSMDLHPFTLIDPCGYVGLMTTDLSTMGATVAPGDVAQELEKQLQHVLAPRNG